MGMFGWSLPPGCGTLPGEEDSAVEITKLLTKPMRPGVLAVFYDGEAIFETQQFTVPADEFNGSPEYQDTAEVRWGLFEFDDSLSEDENNARAAAYYEHDWINAFRRTNDPKLRWIEGRLKERGIPTRRNGESFHAPILQVPRGLEDAAWAFLSEKLPKHRHCIDDMPDDHKAFRSAT